VGAVAAPFIGIIVELANVAIRKKSCAFAGRCKLKSTRLWTRNPEHATKPDRFNAAENEVLPPDNCCDA
jgi:hypothetical protein